MRVRLQLWLWAMDVFHALEWRRAYLWAVGNAGACVDYGPVPDATGEEPF